MFKLSSSGTPTRERDSWPLIPIFVQVVVSCIAWANLARESGTKGNLIKTSNMYIPSKAAYFAVVLAMMCVL